MSRNFGMSARQPAGGTAGRRARAGAYSTRADPYPLPAGSVHGEGFSPVLDERTKGRAALTFATVFFSLVFAIPLLIAGIMLGSR